MAAKGLVAKIQAELDAHREAIARLEGALAVIEGVSGAVSAGVARKVAGVRAAQGQGAGLRILGVLAKRPALTLDVMEALETAGVKINGHAPLRTVNILIQSLCRHGYVRRLAGGRWKLTKAGQARAKELHGEG